MKWVLIIMMSGTGSGTGAALHSVEFNSLKACEQAINKAEDTRSKVWGHSYAFCIQDTKD